MDVKLIALIDYLFHQNGAVTTQSLTKELDVSVRTIRTYVNKINTEEPGLIKSNRSGYYLDKSIYGEWIQKQSKSNIPQNPEARERFILFSLLKANQPINIFDLTEELFVSYSTIKKDLINIRDKVETEDFKIQLSNNELSVIATEKNKRKQLSSILYEESKLSFLNLESIQKSFPLINISLIEAAIDETFSAFNFYINDYSLINLILHITIAIDRMHDNLTTIETDPNVDVLSKYEMDISKSLVEKLEESFNIEFSESELYEIAFLLISRGTSSDYETITEANLSDFVGEKVVSIVSELLDSLEHNFNILLHGNDFLIRFSLHIKNLIIRAKNNRFSKNPLANEIKQNLPLTYEAAIALSSVISKRANIEINEDEIAFIAFHIGSSVEDQKARDAKIKVCFYSPNYYDMNKLYLDQLSRHFSQDIIISSVISNESELGVVIDDLIITTIPIKKYRDIPVYRTNIIFNEEDLNNLRILIEEIKLKKKKELFELNLRRLITEDLFYSNTEPLNKDKLLKYQTQYLLENNYTSKVFYQEVIERENMSSTAYNSVAIPHSMHMNSKKSGIYITISEEEIEWGNTGVNLVLLLFFNSNDRNTFNLIFDTIVNVIMEPENVMSLVKAQSYSEFIDTMVALCS